MKKFKTLAVVALAVAFAATIMASAAPATNQATNPADGTVGSFIVKLAGALDSVTPIATVGQAKDFFLSRGISIPSDLDLNSQLTQGDLARLCSVVGVDVTASDPQAPIDSNEVDTYVGAVRDEITTVDSTDTSDDSANIAARDMARVGAGVGACCEPNQGCTQRTVNHCKQAGGLFRGVGVACDSLSCDAAAGTCCLAKGGPCIITIAANCPFPAQFRGTQICTKKTCTRDAESKIRP